MIEKELGIWQLCIRGQYGYIELRSDGSISLGKVLEVKDSRIYTKKTIYKVSKEKMSPYSLSATQIRKLSKPIYGGMLNSGLIEAT